MSMPMNFGNGPIRFNVTGLKESIAGCTMFLNDLPRTRDAILDAAANFLVVRLKSNVHVWQKRKAGQHMRDTIKVDFKGPNSRLVQVNKPYAKTENRRPGTKHGWSGQLQTHNFADKSEQESRAKNPTIIKQNMDAAFRKAKMPKS